MFSNLYKTLCSLILYISISLSTTSYANATGIFLCIGKNLDFFTTDKNYGVIGLEFGCNAKKTPFKVSQYYGPFYKYNFLERKSVTCYGKVNLFKEINLTDISEEDICWCGGLESGITLGSAFVLQGGMFISKVLLKQDPDIVYGMKLGIGFEF